MKRILVLLASLAVLASCGLSDAEVAASLELSCEEDLSALPAEGGEVSVKVSFAGCRYYLSEDETADPFLGVRGILYGGSATSSGYNYITVQYAANESESTRTSVLRVSSLDDASVCSTLKFTQLGQEKSSSDDSSSKGSVQVEVSTSEEFQTIEGWGCMNNWGDSNYLTNSEIDALFSTTKGIGLNILRIRISPTESNWKNVVASCKYAIEKYGALILASPWSAPADMKDNGSLNGSTNGVYSHLSEDKYEEYALYLQKFAKYMKDNGAPLYAISVQNEPDWPATYEGCLWSGDQNCTFIREYGHLITDALLTTGESLQMKSDFYKPLWSDERACENFDIVAGHIYGGGIHRFSDAQKLGKSVWMTEHLLNDSWSDTSTGHWTETMSFAQEVNDCMNVDWNAYVWWYGKRYYSFIGDGEEGTESGEILKRGHVMGQYSLHVRPGSVRVGCSSTDDYVKATSYICENHTVVVVLNTYASKSVAVGVIVDGGPGTSASATVTSAETNAHELDVKITSEAVVAQIPANSIATIIVE